MEQTNWQYKVSRIVRRVSSESGWPGVSESGYGERTSWKLNNRRELLGEKRCKEGRLKAEGGERMWLVC